MIAEDEASLCISLRNYLEHLNYNVLTASDGLDCLKVIEANKDQIDILLLDVNMPLKSGIEVIDSLGEDAKRFSIYISTGYASERNKVDRSDPRIKAVLEKPYSLSHLASVLEGGEPPAASTRLVRA